MRADYRERAAECLRLANETTNPHHRATLLEMAQAWLRLLDQAEKNAQADLTYETPPRADRATAATAAREGRGLSRQGPQVGS